MSDVLQQLSNSLEERKQASPEDSYVASLYSKGLDTILKKIGEEATEVVIAAKDGDPDKVVYEIADLWFHTLVLLADQDIKLEAIFRELERRQGTSGLLEKAQRENSIKTGG